MAKEDILALSEQEYNEILLQAVAVIENARSDIARHLTATVSNAYWEIGKLLHEKKIESSHGSQVVKRLSVDLKQQYPTMGVSPRNLWYMKTFYERYKDCDSKVQRSVALLRKHRDRIMERQYKDSGIEWIGDVPRGWKVAPFKEIFRTGKGLSFTKADLVSEGIPVISYGQVHSKINKGTRIDDELIRFIPDEVAEGGNSSRVYVGDFIFADTSEDLDGCGNCVYIDKEIGLYAGYHSVVAFSKRKESNTYLAYLFLTNCWRSQIRCRVSGIKVFSVSQTIIKQTTLLLPPLPEQQAIASYLDTKCAEIDSLMALKQQKIEQLKEYKNSVIYEAVTGKTTID